MIKIERSGDRRSEHQKLDDRLREIKREEGWVDISDVTPITETTASAQ